MDFCEEYAGGAVLAFVAVPCFVELSERYLVRFAGARQSNFTGQERCPVRFAENVAKASTNSKKPRRDNRGHLAKIMRADD